MSKPTRPVFSTDTKRIVVERETDHGKVIVAYIADDEVIVKPEYRVRVEFYNGRECNTK